jgi:hypothetical protein
MSKVNRHRNGTTNMAERKTRLRPWVPGQIWLTEYPIRYCGTCIQARTTIVRLDDGSLWVHSPCPIDGAIQAEVDALGPVGHLIAPGNFHWSNIEAAQKTWPDARVWICPGVERKCPGLSYDGILDMGSELPWSERFDRQVVDGHPLIKEVLFLHRPTKTLIVVDLIENIGDATPGTNWALRWWFKGPFRMWNRPRPAPEYRLPFGGRAAIRASLDRVLDWNFERIIVGHGENIDHDAVTIARDAWRCFGVPRT